MATLRLKKFLRRYTTLSSALETLTRRKLVLLSPSKWDDSNDIFFMDLYRSHVDAQSVLALCFTMAAETYHHWKVFTQGIEGVCIEFEREPLARVVGEMPGILAGPVEYLLIREVDAHRHHDLDRLPFVKRKGYSDEREWRIISIDKGATREFLDVPVELGWISRIVLNPWMPPSLVENLRVLIKEIPGCSHLKIESSHLTNSRSWKDAGRRLVDNSSLQS